MIDIKDKKDCCGCAACVQRCPKRCISLHEDGEGFLYPKVDASLCIDCSICEKVCPVVNQGETREPLAVYAAKNPNEDIRRQSSSGGIFTMLAEYIIDKGGVVFGAAFNSEWEVEHRYAETKEELSAFRGSKYVQSRIGETYKQAEGFLKQGREVLFSGTPCQIAGLRLFLRRAYDNLLTTDFICHGVPSPGVFRQYLKEALELWQKKHKDEQCVLSDIQFRDKRQGWKLFSFSLWSAHSSSALLTENLAHNVFLKGFLANLYLRPACHACPAKAFKAGSDITLADYWEINTLIPELDDDRGVSAITVNTPKGGLLLSFLSAELYETSCQELATRNSALHHSCEVPPQRDIFFENNEQTVSRRVESLTRHTPWQRIKGCLNRYLPQNTVNGLRRLLGKPTP